MQSYIDIISDYTPKLLQIGNVDVLFPANTRANVLIYGEIHGARENADVVYTLARNLPIDRLAVENDPLVKDFIDSASKKVYNFSLIDTDTFDSSILSIEMAKTIATLLREGHVKEVVYIDTYFTSEDSWKDDDAYSPQKREQDLADNILALDDGVATLCLLGQWHTQSQPVVRQDELDVGQSDHVSALYRCRLIKPQITFVHVLYGQGEIRNDGRTLTLPRRNNIAKQYEVRQVTETDFDLHVPIVHKISLPTLAQ